MRGHLRDRCVANFEGSVYGFGKEVCGHADENEQHRNLGYPARQQDFEPPFGSVELGLIALSGHRRFEGGPSQHSRDTLLSGILPSRVKLGEGCWCEMLQLQYVETWK